MPKNSASMRAMGLRSVMALAAVTQTAAFSLTQLGFASQAELHTGGTLRGSQAPQFQSTMRSPESTTSASAGTFAAAAALASVAAAAVMARGRRSKKSGSTARRASSYVNPWEQRVTPTEGNPNPKYGDWFHPYDGPVHNGVPVVEGLEFPLDPTLYEGPLEPPPQGAKWGEGRSPDGNWYFTDGDEKVQYWQGIGKRKRAVAIVRLIKGGGKFTINGKDALSHFNGNAIRWFKACEPLTAMNMKNDYDLVAKVFGGGHTGHADAIRNGLAGAIQEIDFNHRPLLRRGGYMTRDIRQKEMMKPGLPKARKKKPHHKR